MTNLECANLTNAGLKELYFHKTKLSVEGLKPQRGLESQTSLPRKAMLLAPRRRAASLPKVLRAGVAFAGGRSGGERVAVRRGEREGDQGPLHQSMLAPLHAADGVHESSGSLPERGEWFFPGGAEGERPSQSATELV